MRLCLFFMQMYWQILKRWETGSDDDDDDDEFDKME